jgi:hypothetical protein
MLVQLARALDIQYLVDVELEGVAADRANGEGEAAAVFLKHRHHLLLVGISGRGVEDNVLDLELLDGTEQARFLFEVGALARRIVGIKIVAIAFPYPDGLLRERARRLQVVRVQLLGSDVIVGLERRLGGRLRRGFGGVASAHDDPRAEPCQDEQRNQKELDTSFGFRCERQIGLLVSVRCLFMVSK